MRKQQPQHVHPLLEVEVCVIVRGARAGVLGGTDRRCYTMANIDREPGETDGQWLKRARHRTTFRLCLYRFFEG